MDNFKWTPLRHKAAYLLATEPKKYYEIADMLGITVQTLWNWRQEKEFSREITKILNAETKAWLKNRAEIQLRKYNQEILEFNLPFLYTPKTPDDFFNTQRTQNTFLYTPKTPNTSFFIVFEIQGKDFTYLK